MWYGFKNIKNLNKNLKNFNLKINIKTKSLNLNLSVKSTLNSKNLIFYVPADWEFIILKMQNSPDSGCLLYFFSSTYFFLSPVCLNNLEYLFYDRQSRTLQFKKNFNNVFYNTYWTYFKLIFYSFSSLFFKKLKFKGKGYYIYRNKRNSVALQFGYSHLTRIYAFLINLKFITKTSILMFGINKNDLFVTAHSLFKMKSHSVFTGKGIRFSRQIIYKKTGKVGSYR